MNLLRFTIVTFFFITACSKKASISYSITADQNNINYDEISQLKISVGSAADYHWKSSDEFVGTVDAEGKFIARHIGETIITAEKGGKAVSNIKMTVLPTETFFMEPYLEFGQTMSYIKSKEKRKLAAETVTGLGYSETSVLIENVYYFFDTGKLKYALVDFADNATAINRSRIFYDERYHYEGFADGTALYTSKDKKTLIGLSVEDSWGYGALCVQNTSSIALAAAVLKQARQKMPAKVYILQVNQQWHSVK